MEKNNLKIRRTSLFLLFMIAPFIPACGVDRDNAKYDELRYEKIQEADCEELVIVLSQPFFTKNPQDEKAVRQRCLRLKQLSFAEYKQIADRARATGKWDFE